MSARRFAAVFEREEQILRAAAEARRRGIVMPDAHVPYPVHGLDEAMGIRPSFLPKVCFLLGLLGCAFAFAFQSWVSTRNWPLNIGGKPFFAWPAFVPVTFEVTVLLAGVGTVLALFILLRLWPGKRAALPVDGATDGRFVLILSATAAVDAERIARFCRETGAVELQAFEEDGV